MTTGKTRASRPVNGLVRDLIEAACDTLAHDVDILDGTEDYEIANKRTLEKDFLKVLRKHHITNKSSTDGITRCYPDRPCGGERRKHE